METYTLNNGIKTIIKKNKSTPRTAVVLCAQINVDETKAGLYYLMCQMLFQGTKNRNSEQIANELDENAIDLSVEKKYDYIRFKILCLNEDIDYALEIFQDIIENSTFDDFEKEIIKTKGEFESDLDSAKILAQDEYYRTIFKNHPYSIGRKEVIEQIDSITKEDLINIFNDIKYNTRKIISVAGDVESKKIIELLNNHLSTLKINNTENKREKVKALESDVISVIKKEDANQAQIFKGWIFPDIYSNDYPAIVLLNTILGSSGLSSRLFMELREKQGLAYTVRSISEPYLLGGSFTVYIATEPKNIEVSLKGFEREINKIMTEMIGEEELENAKNNAIGKRQFYRETNLLEACLNGYYELMNLGSDFEEKLISSIKKVTKEQILETAEKYFARNSALCVLAPQKNLEEAGLINK